MKNGRKEELIGRILEQVSELPRSRIRDGILLQVILKSCYGSRLIVGCLTRKEIKRASKKGGFRNGTLVLRPTVPALDHEECCVGRVKVPLCQIDDVLAPVGQ